MRDISGNLTLGKKSGNYQGISRTNAENQGEKHPSKTQGNRVKCT